MVLQIYFECVSFYETPALINISNVSSVAVFYIGLRLLLTVYYINYDLGQFTTIFYDIDTDLVSALRVVNVYESFQDVELQTANYLSVTDNVYHHHKY